MPAAKSSNECVTNFGQKVAEQRRLLGLSQHQLAAMTGIDQSILSRIERGIGTPTLANAWTICTALGLDILILERYSVPSQLQKIRAGAEIDF